MKHIDVAVWGLGCLGFLGGLGLGFRENRGFESFSLRWFEIRV